MRNQRLHLSLIASLAVFLAGCAQSITDEQGRKLPALGATARLIEKHGWLPTTEAAIAELMTPPKINLLAVSPEQAGKLADEAIAQNAARLMQEGKLIQVPPGSKVRVVGYYAGDSRNIRPFSPQDTTATWVKVEVLELDGKQRTGFTTADGIE
jgi:hypothetical protein